MSRRSAAALFLAVALAGCQGTLPTSHGDPTQGYGAILVKGKVILPTGETYHGRMALNFESDNDRYVLPFLPGRAELLVVQPGRYQLHPTRGPLGFSEATLTVGIEHRTYRVPFPRDILRKEPVTVAPHHVTAIGILEARRVQPPGERARVEVRLDDSPEARRRLIEEKVGHMMDLNQPASVRETAIAWTQALDQALVSVQSEQGRPAPYKPGPR